MRLRFFFSSRPGSRAGSLPGIALTLAAGLCGLAPGVSRAAATNAPPAEPVPRKSVFVDDVKVGRDPFFPDSGRRAPKVSAAAPAAGEKPGSSKNFSDRLILKGITGKIALINNVDFETGQEAEVKVPGGRVKIRCLEIQEKYVVIRIDGDPVPQRLMLSTK